MKNKKRLVLSLIFVFFIFGVSLPLFMSNHKKVKADTITNLTGTTWILNDTIMPSSGGVYYINFKSNNTNYIRFSRSYSSQNNRLRISYIINDSNSSVAYLYENGVATWYDNSYKTIEITGGTDVTNSNLISWLQANATQPSQGTEITHKYWASYLDINMTNNEVINDDNISYKVLLNTYTDDYNDVTLTGLSFSGLLTSIEDNHSYIISINNNDPITLYKGITNVIDNPMLLEFTLGDYMDDDLYDLMDDTGVWFDDARAYMAGTSFGSIYGFNRGVAYGQADGTQYSNLISSVFNGLGNMLSIQVFPNITIALLIGLPLLLGVFIIIIKILRG